MLSRMISFQKNITVTIKANEANTNIKQKISTEIELHTEEFLPWGGEIKHLDGYVFKVNRHAGFNKSLDLMRS